MQTLVELSQHSSQTKTLNECGEKENSMNVQSVNVERSVWQKNGTKQEEREKHEREERLICRKTIPCWACYDEFPESCPKKKINQK